MSLSGITVGPTARDRFESDQPTSVLEGQELNAIGGLVSAINETIPRGPVQGTHGAFAADFGTAAKDAGAAVDFTAGNGLVELTPRRHMFAVKAGASELSAPLEGCRVNVASRRYKHEELIGGEVGGSFLNRSFAAIGARANRGAFDPEQDLQSRHFTDVSGSVGLLFCPAAANDKVSASRRSL